MYAFITGWVVVLASVYYAPARPIHSAQDDAVCKIHVCGRGCPLLSPPNSADCLTECGARMYNGMSTHWGGEGEIGGERRKEIPTNNALLTDFLLSSDAEILLQSADRACKSAPKRAKEKNPCTQRVRVPSELPFLHATGGGWEGLQRFMSNYTTMKMKETTFSSPSLKEGKVTW